MKDVLSAPKAVFLNITNRCNLHCVYCSADSNHFVNGEELETHEILRLARVLEEAKVFRVVITGGEPLIREDIFTILNELDRHHTILLNTNATLITDEVAVKLADLRHLKGISVSLDGADGETNDRSRGVGSFEQIIGGIKVLRRHRLPVSLQTTITKLNFQHMEEIVALAKSLNIGGISFAHLSRCGRAMNRYDHLALRAQDNIFVRYCLHDLQEKYPYFVSGTYSWIPTDHAKVGNSLHREPRRLFGCGAAKEACAITPEGHVIPCNKMSDFKCGNVRDQRFLDIWQNSNIMNEIRNLKDLRTDAVKECAQCEFRGICGGGCRADAYLVHGSLTAPDPLCWHVQGA